MVDFKKLMANAQAKQSTQVTQTNSPSITKETKMSANLMESLLEGTLDDLADMPEFKLYAPGAHKVIITIAQKKIKDSPAFEIKMKHVEVVELANANTPEADIPKKDQEMSVAFMMDNEFGQGQFKELLKVGAAQYPQAKNLGQVIEAMQNNEVTVVTDIREDKKNDKKYGQIKGLVY